MRKNRFYIPAYLINTAKIKTTAFLLKIRRGAYPYDYFKDRIKKGKLGEYELNFVDQYHSLTYFDSKTANQYHKNDLGITAEIIKGLALYNDQFTKGQYDQKAFIQSAKKILAKGNHLNDSLLFYITEDYDRFDLKGPYTSGIIQGKVASLFLRCFKVTNDDEWLLLSKKALNACSIPVDQGGIKRDISTNMTWVEEYPSPKPSMVLNGFLFWLIGLGEYLSVTEDKELQLIFEDHLSTAINWLPAYKLDNGLLYSMYRWNLCNVHYTAIMKCQFEHIYRLTGVDLFIEYADFLDKSTDWEVFRKMI